MNDKPTSGGRPGQPEPVGNIDLSEKGRGAGGEPVALNRRLFMQFMAFRNGHVEDLVKQFERESVQAVIYQDLHDPNGFGVMAYCEDPTYLVEKVQPILKKQSELEYREEYTMLGRTYAIGYETDLEDVLIQRPVKRVCDPATSWAVYYPLRRSGEFERQSREDQRKMLAEHGGIGHAYGKSGFATDIRLAGHGLNKNDNDFIVGLLGDQLFPLSALVQHMRRTRQTSEFIQSMGPFFIGRVLWQPVYDPNAELA